MTVVEQLAMLEQEIRNLPNEYDTEDSHRIADDKLLSAIDILCRMVGTVEVTRAVTNIQRAYFDLYKEYN